MTDFAKRAPGYRDELKRLKEILLANVVMASEIASPTGEEEELVKYLTDRFIEAGLNSISIDEAGNGAAILNGKSDKNILVAAHIDKIWDKADDHTIGVSAASLSGRGVADNSLGVAVLASLPLILEELGIELDANLVLLGTTKSLGKGDLGGMRFFLDNTKLGIDAGLCLEGIDLGRLSYSSLGMIRGKVTVTQESGGEKLWYAGGAGVIGPLNKIIESIMRIDRPDKPHTSILLGSVKAGSGYNVSPTRGTLRFEVRSESEEIVERIYQEMLEIIEETQAQEACKAEMEIVARRYPGAIDFKHPYVKAARDVMDSLEVQPRIAPSTSELSALLDRGIPSLTLGLTTGEHRSSPIESILIDPIFTGVAQIAATLQHIDESIHA